MLIMNHRFFKDRMLLYIDGELSAREHQRCRDHLTECASCRQQMDALAAIWQNEADEPVTVPSVRLRAQIESAMRGKGKSQPMKMPFTARLVYMARPALVMAILVIGMVIGAYLGRISTPLSTEDASMASNVIENENELAASYMESFQDLPPESVGRAYMLVTVDE